MSPKRLTTPIRTMKRIAARSFDFWPELADAAASIVHSSSGNLVSPAARVGLSLGCGAIGRALRPATGIWSDDSGSKHGNPRNMKRIISALRHGVVPQARRDWIVW